MTTGVSIRGRIDETYRRVLTAEAVAFLASLHRAFAGTRAALLQRRRAVQAQYDAGVRPGFLAETRGVREDGAWQGAPPAPGLVDRRVEITGPVDRKMVVNALNTDVCCYMADFEDSSCPMWDVLVAGQVNLYDAVRGQIDFVAPNGKTYALRGGGGGGRRRPTLIVRPRGWHLDEKHLTVDGRPIAGALFDFGLFFFHNARELVRRGAGPYFYLPKLESHLEARLWNDIFNVAQDALALPRGTIRATVLIETIPAAFEMDEIIYELRTHSAGLNCGRWDYIFSLIKKFRNDPAFVLPDRRTITMMAPFMSAYVELLIRTCHRRGVHAMGGMAAQIPIKNDPQANKHAMEMVYTDKLREVQAGHDGTWIAHPDLGKIALEVFNQHMPTPNQLAVRRDDVQVTPRDLLNVSVPGQISEDGIRENVSIALTYLEAWLRGAGCVPIHNLMEDAATAEISRSQLWQWAHHQPLDCEGRKVTPARCVAILHEQTQQMSRAAPKGHKFHTAARYLETQLSGRPEDWSDFLTTMIYDEITTIGPEAKI